MLSLNVVTENTLNSYKDNLTMGIGYGHGREWFPAFKSLTRARDHFVFERLLRCAMYQWDSWLFIGFVLLSSVFLSRSLRSLTRRRTEHCLERINEFKNIDGQAYHNTCCFLVLVFPWIVSRVLLISSACFGLWPWSVSTYFPNFWSLFLWMLFCYLISMSSLLCRGI